MNIILLSGGSGKRLWPLSNEIRSKQFLRVVKDKNGETQSMLQRVYGQIKEANLSDNILVTASKVQYESIRSQLGNKVSVVLEPERRDTFPAIMLSCAYLALEQKRPLSDVVSVLPVDPYVDMGYFHQIRCLEEAVIQRHADIALMGVCPSYPAEKYGYIIPIPSEEKIQKVQEFREKPNVATASQLIERGGLWNCGVFAFRLGFMMDLLKQYLSFSTYEDVLNQYGKLKKISFDYEVAEKARNSVVVSYDGEWKDLGTWNTLTEVMGEVPLGNVVIAETCANTHVINELDIPIVVMGTKNLIVAASPDGILVSEKEQSSYLKKYVPDTDARPMFEEREWGEYKVLDLTVGQDGVKSLTKRKVIRPNEKIEYQMHRSRAEVWTILSGQCELTIDDRCISAKAGDTFSIPAGVKHGLYAITQVELIEVQVGEELREDGTEMVH